MISKTYTKRQLQEAIDYWSRQLREYSEIPRWFFDNQFAGKILAALAKTLDAANGETIDEYLKAVQSYEYENFRIACEDREELFYAVLDKVDDSGVDPMRLNDAMRGVAYTIDYDGVYHAKGTNKQINAANDLIIKFFADEWFKMTDEKKDEICLEFKLDKSRIEDVTAKFKPRPPKTKIGKIKAWPEFTGRPGAVTRQKYLFIDRMLIVMARLMRIEKDCADKLARVFRAGRLRSESETIRAKLFGAVFKAFGVQMEYEGYPIGSGQGFRPVKDEYHLALARLFAREWKNRRDEMEKLCADVGLDGEAAAKLAD